MKKLLLDYTKDQVDSNATGIEWYKERLDNAGMSIVEFRYVYDAHSSVGWSINMSELLIFVYSQIK